MSDATGLDPLLVEAMREVDAMFPGTPPIAPPRPVAFKPAGAVGVFGGRWWVLPPAGRGWETDWMSLTFINVSGEKVRVSRISEDLNSMYRHDEVGDAAADRLRAMLEAGWVIGKVRHGFEGDDPKGWVRA